MSYLPDLEVPLGACRRRANAPATGTPPSTSSHRNYKGDQWRKRRNGQPLDLLRSKHILVTHGTGFNWPEPDHFRIVCLPEAEVLDRAISAISGYLGRR